MIRFNRLCLILVLAAFGMEKIMKEQNSNVAGKDEQNDAAEGMLPNKRKKYGTSCVWNYFDKSADGKTAKCIKCGKTYQTSGNTTNLSCHLKRIHPNFTISNDTAFKTCVLKYFCVPATSTESEQMFSKAGLVIREKRSSIKAKNVNVILFLSKNDWIN
ncbi:uncharacterized protein LOC120447670 isoform X2 [Drosophila santomea]|uniref:uncharacterized protein LOC120447670 isoform X2 n=1 Tax=Drosophila santomea TaxID=129105 RepID=UPI001954C70B|nr:uncharacterized protein LOC120447670 isoform X2 [Drosophila santomea]